ncbi:unnamed protein product [Chrysoparadoxa australica]
MLAGYDDYETHYHNRIRSVFEPQAFHQLASTWWIRVCGCINVMTAIFYLHWRLTRSMIDVPYPIWCYTFLGAEFIMILGLWVGHAGRSFPIDRVKVYMDDLVEYDEKLGDLKVAILLPTAGEKLQVLLLALLGQLQLRLWKSKLDKREVVKVVVLDEKRRDQVQQLVGLVYTLSEVALDKTVREILMREGVAPLSAKASEGLGGFYNFYAHGHKRARMYNDLTFMRGIEIVNEIDKLVDEHDNVINSFSVAKQLTQLTMRARRASCFTAAKITPGVTKTWNRSPFLPCMTYFSRVNAGQPRISPKAGNMNAAIFRLRPEEEPLIGDSKVVVINDARHELFPEFLQRTVPYFFTNDTEKGCYKWADIALVQVPQRFKDIVEWNDPDPLGNQAVTQFDIINFGRDGAGSMMSCGQGSLWRVAALTGGYGPDGVKYINKDPVDLQVGRTGGLGFRSEVLVEDTHTSIDLFRHGWKSVYVNSPGEVLSVCTLPPDTVKWRVKQVLRWHQGAVQLALWKGWSYALGPAKWASQAMRIFAFDAISYFIQSFAGQILLVFPVVFGITNQTPFNTHSLEFGTYFFPFIISATLPTVAALGWLRTSSIKVMRDEQIWFCTSYVQIYAILNVLWTTISRRDPADAWYATATCPTWPLFATFGLICCTSILNSVYWVRPLAITSMSQTVTYPCLFALHSLWPMVSFGLGITVPPAFYVRVFGLLMLMVLISFWNL